MWSGDSPDRNDLRMAREHGLQSLMRLVAWVVITVGLPVDRGALTVEAADYLEEVEAEDDGVAHAADAIAVLIEMTVGPRSQYPWAVDREPERHAVEILAPLIAQLACLSEAVHAV
ncbi:MAG TPA: hypothetical protein VFN48_09805 [Solirubrobacteraceae bacterium]|nr:hypothetical protein [Solirubrobacteraceae bacterium]